MESHAGVDGMLASWNPMHSRLALLLLNGVDGGFMPSWNPKLASVAAAVGDVWALALVRERLDHDAAHQQSTCDEEEDDGLACEELAQPDTPQTSYEDAALEDGERYRLRRTSHGDAHAQM